jgi:hypothetical protein
MPRYMVERTFPDGLGIAADEDGARTCLSVVDNNADVGVTWLHSYVTEDKRKTFCIYDGAHAGGNPPDGRPQRSPDRRDRPRARPRPLFPPRVGGER